MRASERLLTTLGELGTDRIFGLPGSTEAPLLDALASFPGIHYVLGLHEGVVVGMADGYARATGRPALCNLHTTVGTGNGLTGLFNAWKDRSPVVALVTHKHSEILGRDGFCVGPDLVTWAKPVTKWAWQGIHPHQVADEVARAFKVAGTPPMGPVYLCYPEDLLGREVPPAPEGKRAVGAGLEQGPWPSPDQVGTLARMLRAARRPVFVAGDEVSHTGGVRALLRLSELLSAPVVQEARRSAVTWNVPKDHPWYCGEYSPRNPVVADADLIVALGCRLSVEFSPVSEPDVPPGATLVHVHRDPWEIGKLYPPTLGVVAAAGALLDALLQALGPEPRLAQPPERTAQQPPNIGEGGLLTPSALAWHLAQAAPENTVLVDEAVRSSSALLEQYPMRPGMYFHSSGGGLGWGLPAALGVQMAWPDRPVVAYLGDGSLLFAVQGLWTAVREGLPVKVIVPNNHAYLAVKAGLLSYRGAQGPGEQFPGVALDRPQVDLVRIAQGFGVPGRKVADADGLPDALHWAFTEPGPVVLDVDVTRIL